MPHVIVKALRGKTEDLKTRLAEAITRNVMEIFGNDESAVSIAIEDIATDRWREDVFLPDIPAKTAKLYKKPGYKM